ncbi:hypothetical protein CEXT_153261 [Caerostris extrusa]|uniref:Uncharacterized protein n=1 Tax=Caerostris extrusa TaxID=172846 RepID=A0AAV4R623_CAEEX|nr:hypothetical protein CEXT_153261 [Caerostris extrusa]
MPFKRPPFNGFSVDCPSPNFLLEDKIMAICFIAHIRGVCSGDGGAVMGDSFITGEKNSYIPRDWMRCQLPDAGWWLEKWSHGEIGYIAGLVIVFCCGIYLYECLSGQFFSCSDDDGFLRVIVKLICVVI